VTVQFHTLGCKLNQIETEAIASAFRQQPGFVIQDRSDSGSSGPADLIIINTCTVTGKSEQKARRIIRLAERENPDGVIIVTGCYAEMDAGSVKALGSRVIASGQEGKIRLLDLPARLTHAVERGQPLMSLAESFLEGEGDHDPFRFEVSGLSFHSRPFLKIQEGCDNLCTYCRVRLARGASRSLETAEIIRRVRLLEQAGHREVVLTGVNIDSWNGGETGLPGLIRILTDSTDSIRFRLSSLNPEVVSREFVAALAGNRVCPHFHLSVQSGSAGVLKRMLRHYPPSAILSGLDLLREYFEDPFIAADIITGFPGETEAEWLETENLVRKASFAALHVFTFSPRPGTAAEKMTPRIPERTAGERAARLAGPAAEGTLSYARRWTGRILNPLAEGANGRILTGLSENYLNIPFAPSSSGLKEGEIYPSRLTETADGFRFVPV
jgi:threonylcarbamoyladenosine tRNA methylthiotransferase MtaB